MTAASSPASTREILITRVFDAPPAAVCAAFLDGDRVGLWWGPVGLRMSIPTAGSTSKPR